MAACCWHSNSPECIISAQDVAPEFKSSTGNAPDHVKLTKRLLGFQPEANVHQFK